MKLQIGGCCACENIVTGSTPMALDVVNAGNYTVSAFTGGIKDEWFFHAKTTGTPSHTTYRLRWDATTPGEWTEWIGFTNVIDVSRKPNPISSGMMVSGTHVPSQGFFPRDHFMRPARITGFRAVGIRPWAVGTNQNSFALRGQEWRMWLNGVLLSNDPDTGYMFGALNLPGFDPQPEGTTNADYIGEGLELRIEIRFRLAEWAQNVQLNMAAHPGNNNAKMMVGYEFENGWDSRGTAPSDVQVAEAVQGGVGWYTGAPDPTEVLIRAISGFGSSYSSVYYNVSTVYYNGAIYIASTPGQVSAGAPRTGFKPDGSNACPFGPIRIYDFAGRDKGDHPTYGYPNDGETTFKRHFVPSTGGGDMLDWRRVRFAPNSRTITLQKGFDFTQVPYQNRLVGINGSRRDSINTSSGVVRREPADPYWPP